AKDKPIKLDEYRKNSIFFHYYNEIVRYWNLLNYIMKKTHRAMGLKNELSLSEEVRHIYATYRFKFESSQQENVVKEFDSTVREQIRVYLNKLKTFSLDRALRNKSEREKLSIVEAFPSFFIEHLLPVISLKFLKDNIHYMNNQQRKGYFFIREAMKSHVENFLTARNIKYKKDGVVEGLYQVPIQYKKEIIRSESFKQGNIILQDKSSVSVVNLLDPRPNELICDICAAPGMKTTLIAQYSDYSSRIIALDFSLIRIKQFKGLKNHNNPLNLFLLNTDSIKIPIRPEIKFDKILLDAPCTGSGALGPHPELKRRQSISFLFQNSVIQNKLLNTSLSLLKKNGILVYSTCSLYPEEGEYQIKKILNQVTPLEIPSWFSPSYRINGKKIPGAGRLFPSIHESQGFFIGKYQKKE
ncbi:MAG: hypothetical protein ACFE8P_16665, partial [Promethearchaeota archaeon]